MRDFAALYSKNYHLKRLGNDLRRQKSFAQEKSLLERYLDIEDGHVLDIGCSTGEFLSFLSIKAPKFGMEISETAKLIAIKGGISFDKNIFTEDEYFNLIIFRGTIQYLPEPFLYIAEAYKALKKGGVIAFTATPNANSIVYKCFNDLPCLDPIRNFFIPSDIQLSNVLKNFGFTIAHIEKPYLRSPYASPFDLLMFIWCFFTMRKPNFAFYGSMMNIIALKN